MLALKISSSFIVLRSSLKLNGIKSCVYFPAGHLVTSLNTPLKGPWNMLEESGDYWQSRVQKSVQGQSSAARFQQFLNFRATFFKMSYELTGVWPLAIEDFTQTDHVTSVAVAEVNKPPPPLVADEQTRSLETRHLKSRCFVCNVLDRWVHKNSAWVCAIFIYFLVVVLSPNEVFAPPSTWKVSVRREVKTYVFVFPHEMCQLWGVLPYLVPTANRGDQSATKGKQTHVLCLHI